MEEGEDVTERVRAVKTPDEIRAMRCAHHACEAGIAEMEAFARTEIPQGGVSEDDDLGRTPRRPTSGAAANGSRRGFSRPAPARTRGSRNAGRGSCRTNEIVAFDTDLIGAYGFCVDITRTWWIGDARPSNAMVSAMHHALDHIADNKARLEARCHDPRAAPSAATSSTTDYWKQKYSCKMHGVGLCDEWPFVPYPDHWVEGAFDTALEPGMVLCVEALVSPEGGDFSIKLEEQVLIADTGHENLTRYPFDLRLTGAA